MPTFSPFQDVAFQGFLQSGLLATLTIKSHIQGRVDLHVERKIRG